MRLSPLMFTAALAALLLVDGRQAQAQSQMVVFENFNVDEGRFNRSPGFSGSSTGFQRTPLETPDPDPPPEQIPNPGTAEIDLTMGFEGPGSQRIDLWDDLTAPPELAPTGGFARLRHLSGTGIADPANAGFVNTPFTTTSGEDGWIGFAVKTTAPGWFVSLWIETSPNSVDPTYNNNGGVPKEVIADGQWHIYQWDLDNIDGDENGWGSVAGIINGSSVVADDEAHTIDSIIFTNNEMPEHSTIWIDYIVKTASGMIVAPEDPVGPDFNQNGQVDGADFLIWQRNTGISDGSANNGSGDANDDGNVNIADFNAWAAQFGNPASLGAASQVPEPASAAIALVALAGLAAARRRVQR